MIDLVAVATRSVFSGGWAGLAGHEDRALPTVDVQPAFPTLTTTAPLNVTTANALRVSDAFACIRVLADGISTLPLHAYRRTATGRQPADRVPARHRQGQNRARARGRPAHQGDERRRAPWHVTHHAEPGRARTVLEPAAERQVVHGAGKPPVRCPDRS